MELIESEKINNYPSFKLTAGMILRDLIFQKKVKPNDLLPILGPVSLVREYLLDKRAFRPSQIKQLADFFGVNEDIFFEYNGVEHQNPLQENILGDDNANFNVPFEHEDSAMSESETDISGMSEFENNSYKPHDFNTSWDE